MKRSAGVFLSVMRKAPAGSELSVLQLSARLGLVVGGTTVLAGCGEQTAIIYKTVADCTQDNVLSQSQCETAYRNARSEWQRTAPRYQYRRDCEYEFGEDRCFTQQGSFLPGRTGYMPVMSGFMLGSASDDNEWDFDRPKPLASSRKRRSPLYGKWVGAGGQVFGKYSQRRVQTGSSAFKPLKGSGRVLGRGGFGRTVSSRSSGS